MRATRATDTSASRTRAAAAALFASVLPVACTQPKPPPPPIREAGFVTLTAQPVALTTELAGRTSPFAVAEVRPQITGLIQKRLFKEGASVAAGDALYQIDPATYRAARDQAAAQLASAEANYTGAKAKADRSAALAPDGISRQAAEDAVTAAGQADAAVQQAKAALQAASINLGYTRILAPISGQIGRSAVTEGALVSAGQASSLATIYQLDPIYVDITESSSRLLELRKALQSGNVKAGPTDVTLKLDDGSIYPHPGRIEFSEASVDQATGAVTIRASVPNPEKVLLPGMFVRVIASQGVIPEAVLAPQQGVSRDAAGRAIALVMGADNKAEGRRLVADRAIGDQWLVTSGLKPGDRLIVEGVDRIRPGQTVKPVPVTLAKAK